MNNEKDTTKDRVEKQAVQPSAPNHNGASKIGPNYPKLKGRKEPSENAKLNFISGVRTLVLNL